MSRLRVRVARKRVEAEGVCSYELVPLDGAPLPPFGAGAHIDVYLRDGLVRQYSLCNTPSERHRYQIAVLREPASRGGSLAMHEEVLEGGELEIGLPRNLFPLAEDAPGSLLLAGGIGITPILAMAESLAAQGAPFELHYSARAPERAAFRERLADAAYAQWVHLHFDSGAQANPLDLAALLAAADPATHLYACGPAGYIAHVADTARAHGWPERQVHFEHFSAAPAASAAIAESGGERAFSIKLASSGRVLEVPAGTSALSVLTQNGVAVSYACEQGFCGTCLTRVLEGVPDHRDSYLTDEERAANDQFAPCCSRACGDLLVLDL